MRYVQDDEEGETIETGEIDLDYGSIEVHNSNGFGACDIQISGGIMTWAQLDKLKAAIAEAERRWRHEPTGEQGDD